LIITDKNKLKIKCEKVKDIREGEDIAVQLLDHLSNSEIPGIGLAANQIGINKRVCVVNVKEPLALINPVVVEKSKEMFAFQEGCLSFPKEYATTRRHVWVKVKCDNIENEMIFTSEGSTKENYDNALECACIQHEIDHLDGVTMFDRELKSEPIVRGKNAPLKIGRNQKITIERDGDTKIIKYKKIQPYVDKGWKISV
tara:strand:+ start:82 stop:678 length:597 start_codon:yes stop_codon:yes gene_type:complete